MRTTLTIDDDVLFAAKEMADSQHKSLGEVISTLARTALSPRSPERKTRNGILLLESRGTGVRITSELIKQLDEEVP